MSVGHRVQVTSTDSRKRVNYKNCVDLPKIVTLCGSTRFGEAFEQANLEATVSGYIVLTIGCNLKLRREELNLASEDEAHELKGQLDVLHIRKIDISDAVIILNVGGYIGLSTKNELEYAHENGKRIYWWEPPTEWQVARYGGALWQPTSSFCSRSSKPSSQTDEV